MERIGIYTKDIQILTGKSEKHSRGILKKVREDYNKLPHQLVTVKECCEYLGIPTEDSLILLRVRK